MYFRQQGTGPAVGEVGVSEEQKGGLCGCISTAEGAWSDNEGPYLLGNGVWRFILRGT